MLGYARGGPETRRPVREAAKARSFSRSCAPSALAEIALGTEEGAACRSIRGKGLELYVYARTLQRQGNANRAFELFPQVAKEGSQHSTQTRGQCGNRLEQGRFRRRAPGNVPGARHRTGSKQTSNRRSALRLEAKEDINK